MSTKEFLFRTIHYHHLDTLKKMLTDGVNIRERDDCGQTPLMLVCAFGDKRMFDILVEHDSSLEHITMRDYAENSVLMFAASGKEVGEGITHKCGFNAQHYMTGHKDIVKVLLSKGLTSEHIKKGDTYGKNALMAAAMRGNRQIAELLLEAEPSLIETTDDSGISALGYASKRGKTRVMELLLSKDPSLIHKVSNEQRTPLMGAATYGKIKAVKLLLQMDPTTAHINRCDIHGFTALIFAARHGHTDVVRYLLQADD